MGTIKYQQKLDPDDIIGKKQGKLLVQSFLGKKPYFSKKGKFCGYDYIYQCLCDCGKTVEVKRIRLLKTLSVQSCGCLKTQNMSKQANPYWKGWGDISGTMWGAIRHNAKVRNISFDITIEQAWGQFEQQGELCNMTGVPLIIAPKTSGVNSVSRTTASLDRINNDLGYTVKNIQWVHQNINQMKNVFTIDRFLEICRAVTDHINGVPNTTPDYKYPGSKPNKNWRGCGDISGYLWSRIKGKARDRNISVTVSHQDIWEQFSKQKGRCALTGWTLNPVTRKHKLTEQTASLDRIDNTKGYDKDNIQWVHKNVNRMKYVYSTDEVVQWCRKITKYAAQQELSATGVITTEP